MIIKRLHRAPFPNIDIKLRALKKTHAKKTLKMTVTNKQTVRALCCC